MGVVDGIYMVLDDVWRSSHCLIKILATRPDLIKVVQNHRKPSLGSIIMIGSQSNHFHSFSGKSL